MESKIVSDEEGWESFCEIARAAFEGWNPEIEALSTQVVNFIFSENNEDIGIVTVHIEDPKKVLLRNVAIKPEKQGKGFGTSLLSSLEEIFANSVKTVELMAEPHNVSFYQASGYNLQNTLHNALDWRYMTKDL